MTTPDKKPLTEGQKIEAILDLLADHGWTLPEKLRPAPTPKK